ncbi:nicotinate-nucleotide adenylyltransferase [Pseudooceanicola antarcticus]|uniref:Probable nicotinate-nucleotide adenylyltransferase n=1 Tax=Pseudooceanicola antarcticus TaxID=1247613 RepID=A0A285IPC0_9RHOB|nr:nicotinate-nucleotide adenylyltransferase [Pseudooceanicola antarcticus]PJE31467.1 nicotinate-nucleotide adenylyltransferase [Pseudooceanicola antarcticus]SNY49860.1 nicotinate-nucleotide adenylyltransferase [Pseudooceanicola antarcticus]
MPLHRCPIARPGQRIGLLGGSFDPAHEGHVHITREALKRFRLDRVWWLVSPGNPLKKDGPAPLEERMQAARALMRHPRVDVTDIEARLGSRYTAHSLRALKRLYPGVAFTWLMGADNLVQFDRWQEWRWILANVPIGVLARPGERLPARNSRTARIAREARVRDAESHGLGGLAAPAWCFVDMPMRDISSSEIRARGEWRGSEDRPTTKLA